MLENYWPETKNSGGWGFCTNVPAHVRKIRRRRWRNNDLGTADSELRVEREKLPLNRRMRVSDDASLCFCHALLKLTSFQKVFFI